MRLTSSFLVVSLALGSVPAMADWSGYQGGNDHTGFVDEITFVPNTSPNWTYTGVRGYSGIAVADGKVFAATDGYFNLMPFVAIDLASGLEAWRIDFSNIFSVNAPLVDSGVVYFATGNHSGDTYMRAYDAATGRFLWRTNFLAQWEEYLAPIVLDGLVIANGGYYGGIYAFDQVHGEQRFWGWLPQHDRWSPVPWGNDRLLAYTNRLDILDRATGESVGVVEIPEYSAFGYGGAQTPVVVGNIAYLTNGGRLIAIDLVTQSVRFARNINTSGQISTDGQRLYLISSGVLNVRSLEGDSLYSIETPNFSMSAPIVVSRTHAFVSLTSGQTAVIDLASRLVVRTVIGQGQLAIADDVLVIAGEDGVIKAFDVGAAVFADDFEG